MWHEILITDLTRMSEAHNTVCVAGINRDLECIRPEMRSGGGIPEAYLTLSNEQRIAPRQLVRINLEPHPLPVQPHIEDHFWHDIPQTEVIRQLSDTEWHRLLERTVKNSVRDIFEVDLSNNNRNIAEGNGVRSLGTIEVQSMNNFIFQQSRWDGRLDYRLEFNDKRNDSFTNIKVTDLALQKYAQSLRATQSFSTISQRLTSEFEQSQVFLRIGLSRPFNGWCWLLITGVYTFPDYVIE